MNSIFAMLVLGSALIAGGVQAEAQSGSDKKFLEKDSQGNVAEVELGKLATVRGTSPDVRAFARKMIRDHEKLARSFQPFVEKAGVQASHSLDTKHQRLYNRLNGLSGSEFDKEYAKAMDEDHHEDLEAFKNEIASTQDPALKAAVIAGQKIIALHTLMIDDLSRRLGLKPVVH